MSLQTKNILKEKNIQSFHTQWLKEPNFKKLFFENLKEKKYQIFLNTEILKFQFKKKNCEYVEIASNNIIKRIYPKTIILCAGTFGNIEIMLKHKKTLRGGIIILLENIFRTILVFLLEK